MRVRRLLVTGCACVATLLALALPTLARADGEEGQLGPKPAFCGIGCWGGGSGDQQVLAVSRSGYFLLQPTIIHEGQKIHATWIKIDPDASWDWPVHGKGCHHDSLSCTFKPGATNGWAVLDVGIGTVQGPALSEDAYAVIGKDQAVVDGYVNDRTGGGVGGVSLSLSGTRRYHAITGSDGFFSVIVKPGHYEIDPSGGPGKRPRYDPRYRTVDVRKGETASADFTLQNQLDISLKLGDDSLPADGYHVVKATITARKFGKPAPNEAISLQAQPGNDSRSSARGTLCDAGGSRVWPQGTLGDPNLGETTVTTDEHGRYTFDVQVGTVPGRFEISAWAQDGFGRDITDDTDAARDTATIHESALGDHPATSFLDGVSRLAGTVSTSHADDNAYDEYKLFSALTDRGSVFGGIAYAYLASGSAGSSVLLYDAAQPPRIKGDGDVSAPGAYVLSPSEYVGTVNLGTELQTGKLPPPLPTFSQWSQGRDTSLFQLAPATAQAATSSFEGFGYGYPEVTGGCS